MYVYKGDWLSFLRRDWGGPGIPPGVYIWQILMFALFKGPTSLAIYILNVFANDKYMCVASYNYTTKSQFCCVAFSIVL